MNKIQYFSSIIFALNLVLAQNPIWPTNASRMISSNFGEFREDHFHMGIDIKTGETEGHPVFAVESGYISRMVTNYSGYGKALYLTTTSNHIAVFGHLSRFSPLLEEVLRNNQISNQSYFVDEYFSDFEFPVTQGDVIGYTGNTGGSFGPHLHFEYRDKNDQTLNPFRYGFEIPDRFSPMLKQIAITPIEKGTIINGSTLSQVFPLFRDRSGFFHFPDTINCWGTIGISVQLEDQIQGSPHKYQIYKVELLVDKNLYYQSLYDTLNFNKSSINQALQYKLFRSNSGEFHQLYHLDSYPNSPVQTQNLNGKLSLDRGSHTVEIKVWDTAENLSTTKGIIVIHPPFSVNIREINRSDHEINFSLSPLSKTNPLSSVTCYSYTPFGFRESKFEIKKENQDEHEFLFTLPLNKIKNRILQCISVNEKGAFAYPEHWTVGVKSQDIFDVDVHYTLSHTEAGLNVQIETNSFTDASVSVQLLGNKLYSPILVNQIQPTVYLSDVLSPGIFKDVQTLEVVLQEKIERKIHFDFLPKLAIPNDSVLVTSVDKLCTIQTTKSSVHDSTILWIDLAKEPIPSINGIQLSKAYQLNPFDIPLHDTIHIVIQYDRHYNQEIGLGLYYFDLNEKLWTYIPTRNNWNENYLTGYLSSLELVTIIQDNDPPEIINSFPAHGGYYDKKDVMNITASFRENLAGIEPDEQFLKMFIDSIKLISAYQPVKKQLSSKLGSLLSEGEHELLISVEDRAGNQTKKTVKFSVY